MSNLMMMTLIVSKGQTHTKTNRHRQTLGHLYMNFFKVRKNLMVCESFIAAGQKKLPDKQLCMHSAVSKSKVTGYRANNRVLVTQTGRRTQNNQT